MTKKVWDIDVGLNVLLKNDGGIAWDIDLDGNDSPEIDALHLVISGLDPAIHLLTPPINDDLSLIIAGTRVKPGHDGSGNPP